MKELRYGEAVRMLRNGKWETATVLEKEDESKSYILKTENRRMYRQNRSHIYENWSRWRPCGRNIRWYQ